MKLPAIGNRTAIVETAADYARMFQTMADMEERKVIRPAAADAIRVLALTGARKSEIAKLTWAHVDLKNGRIILPPSAHKTGKKTGQRVITVPAAAQEIIARQPSGAPGQYVFSPFRGAGSISLAKPWTQIRKAAELPENLGLHGLRHSVGSHLAMGGAQTAQIMEALGHRQLSTTARYMHFAENAKQALAERAASVALAGLNALPGVSTNTVIDFEPHANKGLK